MRRLVIIGAGAVGASLAAELHTAGRDVLLVARGAQLTALRSGPLTYVRPDGPRPVRLPVAAGPGDVELREGDVLVLAVKSQDTEAAVRAWAWRPVKRTDGSTGLAGTDLPLLTVQNGLANERAALRFFAEVIGAVIWIPAQYTEAGTVLSPGAPVPAVLWLGSTARSAVAAAELRAGGFDVREVADIAPYKAGKLLGNLYNGLDALYGGSELRERALAELRREAREVFAAAGVAVETPDTGDFHVAELPGYPRGHNSTWQSLARGAAPETDYLHGEVVLLARLSGAEAPLNAAIQARVQRAYADGVAAGSLDDADLLATLPALADRRAEVLVTAAELHRRLAGPQPPVLLDVRWALGDPHGEEHYREGHLPGAVYVDLDTELAGPHEPGAGRHPLPDVADLQAHTRRWGITRSRGVVVYDNSGGLAAARAWWLLRWAGITGVRILDGGLAAWAAEGFAQATGTAAPQPPSQITLSPGHLPTLTADEAAALPATGVLLDARAGERYRGEVEPIDPRAGHIPGAVSRPTGENLVAGDVPVFRPDLSERFADLAGERVGVYCGSGVTAAHEIAALAVAGIDAALYPGSWSAWSSDPDRPVETTP
nr:rhodanese-like domain-containing protein [Actinoplanes lichenis]